MDAKRVLILVGSPHKGGATLRASRKFAECLEQLGGVTTEVAVLSDYDIGMCRGCKVCFNLGEEHCPLRDDRDILLGKMQQADGVVFASPNYSWQVSGVMKVFLDRIGFALHRPQFHGKTATAIVVHGIALGGRVRKYLEFVAGGLGFKLVRGSVSRTLEPMTSKAVAQMDATLAKHARRFHAELMRPAYPTPSLFALMMFRMGRTGIRKNAPREMRDWNYYREQGWFESDYYYPVRLSWPKRVLGRFFDWFTDRANLFAVAKDEIAE